MKTVEQYSKERKIPKSTIYSWIARGQAEKNGFTVQEIGNIKLITPIKK